VDLTPAPLAQTLKDAWLEAQAPARLANTYTVAVAGGQCVTHAPLATLVMATTLPRSARLEPTLPVAQTQLQAVVVVVTAHRQPTAHQLPAPRVSTPRVALVTVLLSVKVTIKMEAPSLHAEMVNTQILALLDARLAHQAFTALDQRVSRRNVLRVLTQERVQPVAQLAQTGMRAL